MALHQLASVAFFPCGMYVPRPYVRTCLRRSDQCFCCHLIHLLTFTVNILKSIVKRNKKKMYNITNHRERLQPTAKMQIFCSDEITCEADFEKRLEKIEIKKENFGPYLKTDLLFTSLCVIIFQSNIRLSGIQNLFTLTKCRFFVLLLVQLHMDAQNASRSIIRTLNCCVSHIRHFFFCLFYEHFSFFLFVSFATIKKYILIVCSTEKRRQAIHNIHTTNTNI